MKRKHLLALIVLTCLGVLASGCRSDVDLNAVDTRAEVGLNFALPIGKINVSIGALLGTDSVSKLSISPDSVLTFSDSFTQTKEFNLINLAERFAPATQTINMHDILSKAKWTNPATGEEVDLINLTGNKILLPEIPGYDCTYRDSVLIEVPVELNGFNREGATERLDKAQLADALFSSIVTTENFPSMKWSWVDKIVIDLGKNVIRPDRQTRVTIYDKSVHESDFGEKIELNMNNSRVILMKDTNATAGKNNIEEKVLFKAIVHYTIPSNTLIEVPTNAKIQYTERIDKVNFKAVWGWFNPSNQMYDEGIYDISTGMEQMPILANGIMPFSRPHISMDIKTQIAGAVVMHGDYLKAIDSNGNDHFATFSEGPDSTVFDKHFEEGEYLDPVKSSIYDTAQFHVAFNNHPDSGHLDKVFLGGIPKKLAYKFSFHFDSVATPQVRLLPNTSVEMKAKMSLPLAFHEGLKLTHMDTLDVDVSQLSIDSLLKGIAVVDTVKNTQINLVLSASNTIPMDIKAVIRCYDSIGNVMTDTTTVKGDTIPFSLVEWNDATRDTLFINAPTYSNGTFVKAGETVMTLALSKAKLDRLPKIDRMEYFVWIDNQSVKDAVEKGLDDVSFKSNQGLSLQIGLTTKLDAVLDFTKNNNNK